MVLILMSVEILNCFSAVQDRNLRRPTDGSGRFFLSPATNLSKARECAALQSYTKNMLAYIGSCWAKEARSPSDKSG